MLNLLSYYETVYNMFSMLEVERDLPQLIDDDHRLIEEAQQFPEWFRRLVVLEAVDKAIPTPLTFWERVKANFSFVAANLLIKSRLTDPANLLKKEGVEKAGPVFEEVVKHQKNCDECALAGKYANWRDLRLTTMKDFASTLGLGAASIEEPNLGSQVFGVGYTCMRLDQAWRYPLTMASRFVQPGKYRSATTS